MLSIFSSSLLVVFLAKILDKQFYNSKNFIFNGSASLFGKITFRLLSFCNNFRILYSIELL